jgi:hypothetical protein
MSPSDDIGALAVSLRMAMQASQQIAGAGNVPEASCLAREMASEAPMIRTVSRFCIAMFKFAKLVKSLF